MKKVKAFVIIVLFGLLTPLLIVSTYTKVFHKSDNLAQNKNANLNASEVYNSAASSTHTYIMLDPGHGGEDYGTVSGKVFEKNINLDIAERLKAYLSKNGYNVLMTRDTDVFLANKLKSRGSLERRDLEARTKILNSSRATLFVSIHTDSLPSEPDINGSVVYYNPFVKESKKLAASLQDELNKVTANGKKRTSNKPGSANFYILRNADIPGVLVETGFLTSKIEKENFSLPSFRDSLAKAIFTGIEKYKKNK